MSINFDFLTADDKPALVALTNPELLTTAQTVLAELGYKVHTAASHEEFIHKFGQVQYLIVITELLFSAESVDENLSLLAFQNMSMGLRRHATTILFGDALHTFNPMQAFQLSVNVVVNPSDMFLLNQLVQKAIADNELFLHTYHESQRRLVEG